MRRTNIATGKTAYHEHLDTPAKVGLVDPMPRVGPERDQILNKIEGYLATL